MQDPATHNQMIITQFAQQAIPFADFLNPEAVLAEMVRVCKPGGKVMVIDVVQQPEKADAYDHLEKLRDPSHTHALTFPEMAAIIADSGLSNVRTVQY